MDEPGEVTRLLHGIETGRMCASGTLVPMIFDLVARFATSDVSERTAGGAWICAMAWLSYEPRHAHAL